MPHITRNRWRVAGSFSASLGSTGLGDGIMFLLFASRVPHGMGLLTAILLVAAFVLFVIAVFNVPARVNLVAAGLACWVLTVLIGAWPH